MKWFRSQHLQNSTKVDDNSVATSTIKIKTSKATTTGEKKLCSGKGNLTVRSSTDARESGGVPLNDQYTIGLHAKTAYVASGGVIDTVAPGTKTTPRHSGRSTTACAKELLKESSAIQNRKSVSKRTNGIIRDAVRWLTTVSTEQITLKETEDSKVSTNAAPFVPSKMSLSKAWILPRMFRISSKSREKPEQIQSANHQLLAIFPRRARHAFDELASRNCNLPLFIISQPRITIVSEEKKIFVIDLCSEEACDWIMSETGLHEVACVNLRRESWRKLFTYTDCDLPTSEVHTLRPLTNALWMKIRRIIGEVCDNRHATSSLFPRSWKDPHLLRYEVIEGKPEHKGVVVHHDGGDWTWQLMLSSHGSDYSGGGTYFQCLRKTILLRKGQVLVHPGNLHHKGVDIDAGTRTLMVCFMDGSDSGVAVDGHPKRVSRRLEKRDIIYC